MLGPKKRTCLSYFVYQNVGGNKIEPQASKNSIFAGQNCAQNTVENVFPHFFIRNNSLVSPFLTGTIQWKRDPHRNWCWLMDVIMNFLTFACLILKASSRKVNADTTCSKSEKMMLEMKPEIKTMPRLRPHGNYLSHIYNWEWPICTVL